MRIIPITVSVSSLCVWRWNHTIMHIHLSIIKYKYPLTHKLHFLIWVKFPHMVRRHAFDYKHGISRLLLFLLLTCDNNLWICCWIAIIQRSLGLSRFSSTFLAILLSSWFELFWIFPDYTSCPGYCPRYPPLIDLQQTLAMPLYLSIFDLFD